MILKSKICGVSDSKILNFIVNHNYPPQFVGFIVNYPKSKRYVDIKKLKDLMKIEKKNCDGRSHARFTESVAISLSGPGNPLK